VVEIGPDKPTVIIGERINPTGRKVFSAELQAGDLSRVPKDSQAQVTAGAQVLDVNVGAAGVDEVHWLPLAVQMVQDTVDVPVSIDSPNPLALAASLKVAKGRALVNSVSGETAKLNALLPVVAEYGAMVIALCMDDNGIPTVSEERVAIAEKILEQAQKVGVGIESILFDPLVMTVGADHRAGRITLDTARLLTEKLGCNLTVGASNASHGMPDREMINTVFLAQLLAVGVNAPICNPLKNALAVRAADLMLGRDEWAMNYIQTYRALSAMQEQPK
jgi:5-methyltetrahydrofolate--homocysteine methyltransferase